MRTQESRIIFQQEKFVDYKDRENLFLGRLGENKNESLLILEKGMDYIQRSHL